MSEILKIILLLFAVESVVFFIFFAGPLRGIRSSIIGATPFLRIDGEHLLECKTCTSVWVAFFLAPAYFFMDNPIVLYIILVLAVCRMANYIHLAWSYLRDKQFDLRVRR